MYESGQVLDVKGYLSYFFMFVDYCSFSLDSHVVLPSAKGKIIYTETDEAPALATYSLYPVVSKVREDSSNILVTSALVD